MDGIALDFAKPFGGGRFYLLSFFGRGAAVLYRSSYRRFCWIGQLPEPFYEPGFFIGGKKYVAIFGDLYSAAPWPFPFAGATFRSPKETRAVGQESVSFSDGRARGVCGASMADAFSFPGNTKRLSIQSFPGGTGLDEYRRGLLGTGALLSLAESGI